MQSPHAQQMVLQLSHQALGEEGESVFTPFPIPHGQFSSLEVQILHAQPQGLHQA